MSQIFLSLLLDLFSGNNMIITVKDESFGLVLVPRLKVPRLSVSYKILELVLSQMKIFGTVSSRLLQFYSVSSRSRPDLDL